jgi:metallo-beta-lactamase class B
MTNEKSVQVRRRPLEFLWNAPAFRMIGDIYYVGDRGVSSHLITSDDGHVLIDTCMPRTGPFILKSVVDLGFDPRDIKYILVTHAHIDHLGSVKLLAEVTKAEVCIGEADMEAAEKGSTTSYGLVGFEPFKVDVPLKEGDTITVGDKEIKVYHTPGHTPGCCSYGFRVENNGNEYEGFIFGGPGVNVFVKANLQRNIYGGTIQDFKSTLDRLESLPVEVWLGAHPGQNKTFDKLELLRGGVKSNPYIDPKGWKEYLKRIKGKLQRFL